jgi:hypothetical protein
MLRLFRLETVDFPEGFCVNAPQAMFFGARLRYESAFSSGNSVKKKRNIKTCASG